jgi:hypothetical protein
VLRAIAARVPMLIPLGAAKRDVVGRVRPAAAKHAS